MADQSVAPCGNTALQLHDIIEMHLRHAKGIIGVCRIATDREAAGRIGLADDAMHDALFDVMDHIDQLDALIEQLVATAKAKGDGSVNMSAEGLVYTFDGVGIGGDVDCVTLRDQYGEIHDFPVAELALNHELMDSLTSRANFAIGVHWEEVRAYRAAGKNAAMPATESGAPT